MAPGTAQIATVDAVQVPPFREIFERYVRYVHRLLIHLGIPTRHAEDVCQEVFVIASRKHGELTDGAHLKTWLYAIAWRVAAAHRRLARNRREIPVDDPADQLTDPRDPAMALEERRRLEKLDAALAALPEEQRDVFVLYEIEQLVMREISEVIGCSINTAFSRLYAARRGIAGHLGIVFPEEVWKR
ncbi:MAG TPA: sigma-70 family RNA polymerase sigma factor [Polyangiaceae bacterium]|nr:sigma-70 family RNA polymerase sigma factor [Polyangiaceae bacterium]